VTLGNSRTLALTANGALDLFSGGYVDTGSQYSRADYLARQTPTTRRLPHWLWLRPTDHRPRVGPLGVAIVGVGFEGSGIRAQ